METKSDELKVAWGKPEVITPAVLEEHSLSVATAEGNFPSSVIFDSAQVELQPRDPRQMVAWTGIIRLPLTLSTEPASVWYKSDIRGMVVKDRGARILLLADLNGHTFTHEFPDEQEITAGSVQSNLLRQFVFQASALPVRSYTATLMLLVERQVASSLAFISLDSLDVKVNPDLSTG
jgi:hypothetical protein